MDIKGKTCLVTGASSGIGRATAVNLARAGARVVIVARDDAGCRQARDRIAAESGNVLVEYLAADLSRQSEVRKLAQDFKARHQQLHLLINNAGATFSKRTLTEDRVEATLAINAVTPFLLTELLLDRLKGSAPARVINVASGMLAPIKFDDAARREAGYKQMAVYAQSKMAVVLFSRWLAQAHAASGVTIISMTPGMVKTSLGRDTKGPLKLFLAIMSQFIRTPEQAADDIVNLAKMSVHEIKPGGFYKRTVLTEPKSSSSGTPERVMALLRPLVISSAPQVLGTE